MAYTLVPTELIVDGAVTSAKLDTNISISGTLGVTGELTLATHMIMGDNDKIKIGTGGDLEIYHDGSNSYISNSTGNIYLGDTNGSVHIQAKLNEESIICAADGAVTLYHDNSPKLATSSAGVTVTGALAATLSTAAQPNITSVGTLTTLTVDDITINGSTISDAGDLTLDVAGEIILDADGGNVIFHDGGVNIGRITNDSSHLRIQSDVDDKDIIFRGKDGSSYITALTLDMSDAGRATFNNGIADTHIKGSITPLIVRATNTTNTPLWGMYAQYRNTSDVGSGAGMSLGAETANGTEAEYVYVGAIIEDNTDSDQHGTFVIAPQDGGSRNERLRLTSAGNFTITPRAGTATVFNEAGIDSNFRVESSGNAHMLFVDGGNDRVGVGINNPTRTFEVNSGTTNVVARLESTDSRAALEFKDTGGTAEIGNLGNHLSFLPAGIERMALDDEGGLVVTPTAGGHAVFNEGSVDADFRVESNGNTHMLFVDAGNEAVYIGHNSPTDTTNVILDARDMVQVGSAMYQGGVEGTVNNNTGFIRLFNLTTAAAGSVGCVFDGEVIIHSYTGFSRVRFTASRYFTNGNIVFTITDTQDGAGNAGGVNLSLVTATVGSDSFLGVQKISGGTGTAYINAFVSGTVHISEIASGSYTVTTTHGTLIT